MAIPSTLALKNEGVLLSQYLPKGVSNDQTSPEDHAVPAFLLRLAIMMEPSDSVHVVRARETLSESHPSSTAPSLDTNPSFQFSRNRPWNLPSAPKRKRKHWPSRLGNPASRSLLLLQSTGHAPLTWVEEEPSETDSEEGVGVTPALLPSAPLSLSRPHPPLDLTDSVSVRSFTSSIQGSVPDLSDGSALTLTPAPSFTAPVRNSVKISSELTIIEDRPPEAQTHCGV
eukprot:NODE_2256_length_1235_cov_12.701264_g2145_i0.p2 GENE.NODE_2256_length_1235_cov_12.701264_g2145_i0~~NODE_2256_length_1235_cov_12.701264_g2145_i0.p2  ORF type:complete len:228 (+),score=48.05 NODE_2256_length_1235_cov_12.701264_g2145_i0:84-767(+)